MADEGRIPEAQPPAGAPNPAQQAQPQQIQVPVDLSSLASGYVNWFRFTGSAEELIVDLGLAPQLGQMPPTEPIKLTHRLVMSFFTAPLHLVRICRAETRHPTLQVADAMRPELGRPGRSPSVD